MTSSYELTVMRGEMPNTLPKQVTDELVFIPEQRRRKLAFKMRAWGRANYIDGMLDYISGLDAPREQAKIQWRTYPPPYTKAHKSKGKYSQGDAWYSGSHKKVYRGDPREAEIDSVRAASLCDVHDWERFGEQMVGSTERRTYLRRIEELEKELQKASSSESSWRRKHATAEQDAARFRKEREEAKRELREAQKHAANVRILERDLSDLKYIRRVVMLADEMARILINQEQLAGMYSENAKRATREVLNSYCNLGKEGGAP